MPTLDDRKMAEKMWENDKKLALEGAKLAGVAPGKKKLTPEDEDRMWMTEADDWTPEQDAALILAGKSTEERGRVRYPHRTKIMESDGRAFDKVAQARYGLKVAQRVDPTWQPPPPPNALPAAIAPMSEGEVPES